MELYTIYEDKDLKIEIFKPLHEYLEETKVEWLELNPKAKDMLYGLILKEIREKHGNWDCSERLTAANCPILVPFKPISLSPPFDVLNGAMSFITWELSKGQFSKENVIAEIENFQRDLNCEIDCSFFETPLFKVHGYLTFHLNNTLLILLFSIEGDSI